MVVLRRRQQPQLLFINTLCVVRRRVCTGFPPDATRSPFMTLYCDVRFATIAGLNYAPGLCEHARLRAAVRWHLFDAYSIPFSWTRSRCLFRILYCDGGGVVRAVLCAFAAARLGWLAAILAIFSAYYDNVYSPAFLHARNHGLTSGDHGDLPLTIA